MPSIYEVFSQALCEMRTRSLSGRGFRRSTLVQAFLNHLLPIILVFYRILRLRLGILINHHSNMPDLVKLLSHGPFTLTSLTMLEEIPL